MCGIVGILDPDSTNPINPLRMQEMLGAVRHRGPDEFGIYTFQDLACSVGLGNARLSIIDIFGGQQPIGSEDGTLWIVFNGEIFNYRELRPGLERLGHIFKTESDTEVILHLYESYGVSCLSQLNGQFAFAIWDERNHNLFIARDRMGIRPLYYTRQAGKFWFASEIKALLTQPTVPAELDPVALGQIFTFWSPISPRTSFRDILTLPPAHYMLVSADGRVDIQPYWQVDFSVNSNPPPLEEAADHLRTLLLDATRLRLRADVPVGAYLSGGLDSSAITALIRRFSTNRLETFSIAFTDDDFDESQYQQKMARYLGTRHHLISSTYEDIGRFFPNAIWHTETPILRTAPVPLYLLSRLVKEHDFKVVLTGEGADEFLAGYNIFKEATVRWFWARQPSSKSRPLLLKKLYPYISTLRNDATLRQFFGKGIENAASNDFSHAVRWRNSSRSRRIFTPELLEQIGEPAYSDFPAEFSRWPRLGRAQFLEISIFMAEYLLSSQGDRMAMAHSVEGRFPFLDHRVVEYCNQLPPNYKLRGLKEKFILKQAMRDMLPPEIWQRTKRPYRAPIHRSFFPQGRPLNWVSELTTSSNLNNIGLFRPDMVTGLKKKIARNGRLGETDDMMLAGVLSTLLVHRQFITDFHPALPIGDQENIKWVRRESQTQLSGS